MKRVTKFSGSQISENKVRAPRRACYSAVQCRRSALMEAVTKLEKEDASVRVAIYTCGRYIFLTGCRSNHVFLVDTHSIGAELGGNANGILKVYPSNDLATPYQLCTWIWKRLENSGVQAKALQSLVFLRHLSRYIYVCHVDKRE